jgi:RNA polymerase primary sigma factor
LTPREADVVRFGLGDQHPMTLEEIGETFDLTRERVRQIKEKSNPD